MRNDDLIRALAIDLDRTPPGTGGSVGTRVLLAGAAAAAGALGFIMVGLSRSPHLAHGIGPTIAFTLVAALAVAAGAYGAVLRLSRPDGRTSGRWLLLPLAVLVLGVGLELARVPSQAWLPRLIGDNPLGCLLVVTLLSLPVLAGLLLALRHGAPTAPRRTGAMAGLMAGGIVSALYTLHCPEDSLLFIAAWHVPAVLLVASLGAILGVRLLRW